MNITALDNKIGSYIESASSRLGFKNYYFCRAGSTLHHHHFGINSDIDYFLVVDKLHTSFVNDFPGRTSNPLDYERVGGLLHTFYWRVTLERIGTHDVVVHLYTKNLFERYCAERSGPKMYLLNENKRLGGDEDYFSVLKERFPPNILTARSDYSALLNKKYHHRFFWAWRSVCLLREGRWLRNKAEITEWVAAQYPKGSIANKEVLIIELNSLLMNHKDDES